MLNKIKCTFPNAKLSAKMGEYVSVITSLITEFSQRFQDFSVMRRKSHCLQLPFQWMQKKWRSVCNKN